jgi:hypothetical protein
VRLLRFYGNMVGGKREDNPIATITSSNIFSALEKKKKSKKPKDTAGKKDGKKAKADTPPAPELWQAAPIQVASWADCEDDDDFGGLGPVPQWGNDVNKVAQDVDEHKVSAGIQMERLPFSLGNLDSDWKLFSGRARSQQFNAHRKSQQSFCIHVFADKIKKNLRS